MAEARPRKVNGIDKTKQSPIKSATLNGVRYALSHQIGLGAFASVYMARDEWGNNLAAKVYLPGADRRLWETEARWLRHMSGIGAPRLYAAFEYQGYLIIVMENCGAPISRYKIGSLEGREKAVRFIASRLLPAVHRLHLESVYHCDIKPQNILVNLSESGRLTNANLIDFALCRTQAQLDARNVQLPEWLVPPEYHEKRPLVGPALDMWQVGASLLSILKGEPLSYSQAELLAGKLQGDIDELGLPLASTIASALALDPGARPDPVSFWRTINRKS